MKKSSFIHFYACHILIDIHPFVGGMRSMGVARPICDNGYLEAVAKHVHIACTGLAQEQKWSDKRRRVIGFKGLCLVLYPIGCLDTLFCCNSRNDIVYSAEHITTGCYGWNPDVYRYLTLLRRHVVA